MRNSIHQGFTLIEMMVVVAMIAIMAGFAWPAYQGWVGTAALSSAARAFEQSMQQARAEAVARGDTIVVCPYSGNPAACGSNWNNGWEVIDNPATGAAPVALGVVQEWKQGVDLTITPADGTPQIVIAPDGTTTNTDTWVFCDTAGVNQARSVTVFGSGLAIGNPIPGQTVAGTVPACPP